MLVQRVQLVSYIFACEAMYVFLIFIHLIIVLIGNNNNNNNSTLRLPTR